MTRPWFTQRRFLVTGGSGFLGRRIVAGLQELGAKAVVAPRSAEYDLRIKEACDAVIEDTKPDVVIHAAALVGGIAWNRESPGTFLYDNAIMGLQLIDAARVAAVEKLVTIGSACSYPKTAPLPFKESDLWNGYPEETNGPYGIAKRLLLAQQQAYRQQYGMNAIYLVPANLYGPGANDDPQKSHVIPALIKRFGEAIAWGAEEVTLWGSGQASREFLYVGDAALGILMATEAYEGAEPVNLGNGREVTIAHLARMVADLMGYTGRINWDTSQPDGQPRRALDTTRAQQLFGFRATTPLEDGLRRTVEAYRARGAAAA